MPITITCKTCGEEFTRKKNGNKIPQFCSIKCRGHLGGKQREGEIRPCSICGKERYFPQYRLKATAIFCSKECQWESMRKEKQPIYCQSHRNGKRVQIHRLIMEGIIERPLLRTEVVHHKNGNRRDNSIENLQLMTNTEHSILHAEMRRKNI